MQDAKTMVDRPGGTAIRFSQTTGTATIHVAGRFDFNCHQEFRRAYENAGPVQEILVDLGQTEYIDSSALGMLLLLRESVGTARVRIVNCRATVRKILEIANFGALFPLEG